MHNWECTSPVLTRSNKRFDSIVQILLIPSFATSLIANLLELQLAVPSYMLNVSPCNPWCLLAERVREKNYVQDYL